MRRSKLTQPREVRRPSSNTVEEFFTLLALRLQSSKKTFCKNINRVPRPSPCWSRYGLHQYSFMLMTWREFIFQEYRMKMSFWRAVKICSLRYLFRRLVARETYGFVFFPLFLRGSFARNNAFQNIPLDAVRTVLDT